MSQQKTYWHLLQQKRMPTEYELVCSNLHYYTSKGFELNVPLQQWYKRYQEGSPFTCRDWERFYDPRETTYTSYMGLQKTKEVFVDGLLELIENTGYDKGLSETWLPVLSRAFAPLRYPFHGFQMIASYIGQMGPNGRITVAALFQAADEIRRIQRIAYRIRQIQLTYPGFGEDGKSIWQSDPLWQPLREVVEKLLVTYDWGESFVGLNLVLKPIIDNLFMSHFGSLARHEGDYLLEEILFSLNEDCKWQREWSQALIKTVIEDTPQNKDVIQGWVSKWYPLALRAASAFASIFDQNFENILLELCEFYREYLNPMGLKSPD